MTAIELPDSGQDEEGDESRSDLSGLCSEDNHEGHRYDEVKEEQDGHGEAGVGLNKTLHLKMIFYKFLVSYAQ